MSTFPDEFKRLEEDNKELKERIAELEDYLIEFGVHKFECVANMTGTEEHCNCGLAKALKG